jgi:hypothetical protein
MMCVSVFYDSIRYVAIDDVSYRDKILVLEKHNFLILYIDKCDILLFC